MNGMSRMAQDEDIDDLVSSVRDFVSHKEPPRTRSRILLDRLILTPDLRVLDERPFKMPINKADHGAPVREAVKVLPAVQTFHSAGLEATIAELETAVTTQFNDWEADEGETFADAAWAVSAFHKPANDSAKQEPSVPSTPQVMPETDADTTQSAQADLAATLDEDATVNAVADATKDAATAALVTGIDDAELRRVVAEVLQDELGGELGERITRNVRKLVRREINRALTSREFG